MPLYIAKSGYLDRCYRCLTDWLTHWLTDFERFWATQLFIKYKSGALVTHFLYKYHCCEHKHRYNRNHVLGPLQLRQGVYALGVVAALTLSVLIPWVRGHPPPSMLRGELEITKRNFACNQIYPLICNRYTFGGGVRLLNILEILRNWCIMYFMSEFHS